MTQAPGSCDKPPARDNKQRQTNPETLPGLAGLQAARQRRGAVGGGDTGTRRLPPAQLLPRHPAGRQREATATSVPPGSALARGCFSQRDVGGGDLHPNPSGIPPAVPAPVATGSPAVPWPCPCRQSPAQLITPVTHGPGSHHARPHCLQLSRGI